MLVNKCNTHAFVCVKLQRPMLGHAWDRSQLLSIIAYTYILYL